MSEEEETDDYVERRARERVGTVLRGKYRLDRVLGMGGMAVVYAATHRNQAELAVKMLHPELSIHKEIRGRFQREGYVANSVKHSGAVLVVDDDVAEDGSAFLVMEMLHGASVDELAERHGGRLPVRIAVAIAYDMLDVLAAAHSKAIVHRDIKPGNVFVTKDGVVKVLDFGIARIRDATHASPSHATQTGTMMGTPAFMAPEQALAEASKIDAQTDLWSVGAVLFTLIAGVLVHEGNTSPQLLIKAGTTPARPLASLAPFVPPEIAAVVDRALKFEKADRWPNATAMRSALREAYASAYGVPLDRSVLGGLFESESTANTDRQPTPEPASPHAHEPTMLAQGTPATKPVQHSVMNTAEPVSSGSAPAQRRNVVPIVAGVVLALAMGVVVTIALSHKDAAPSPTAETTQAVKPSATVGATSAATPNTQDPGTLAIAPKPEPSAVPPATTSAAAHPTGSVQHAHTAKPVASASASAAATDDCNPNYYFDSEGNRHFKVHCFQK
jgi:serine/threonine-protein kinase